MDFKPGKEAYTKLYLGYLTFFIFSILIAGAVFTLASEVRFFIWFIVIGVNALLWILILPLNVLWIKKISYHISEKSITINQGIITKTEQNINFAKITDFQLHRSLYDRFLNIGSIRIQTAGQSTSNATGYEGTLIGISGWQKLYPDLKARINDEKVIDAKVDSTAGKGEINLEILNELKQIRQLLEKK